MANISFFYPEREKGRALGLNAAGGNLGTAAVQFAVPLVIVGAAGHAARARRAACSCRSSLIAAVLAWRFMDNLSNAKSDPRSYGVAARSRNTWIISFIYIGTFGSFIGFSGAFPTLLKSQFPEVTMLDRVRRCARRLHRPTARRHRWPTSWAAHASRSARSPSWRSASSARSSPCGPTRSAPFLASFLVLFIATGAGNGSVYRMIPAVFRFGATDDEDRARRIKAAAGCLGIAGAIGAFGGFLIPRGFAISTTATGNIQAALWVIVGAVRGDGR